jgi:hypothetical protein
MDIKFVLVIAICFTITIISLYSINETHRLQYDVEKSQESWYGKNFDPDRKKIFIVGSSYVKPFNSTHIEKTLFQNGYEYDVYNLGVQADRFFKRENYIEDIISADPDVIILGFSYAETIEMKGDQTSILLSNDAKPQSILPDPEELMNKFFGGNEFFGIDFYNFENPKLTSLQIIDVLFGGDLRKYDLNSKEPFMGGDVLKKITNHEKLVNENAGKWLLLGSPDSEHKSVIALKEMVKKYEENEIKVIVYVVPFHGIFWDQIGKSNENDFVIMLNNLSNELEITIYDYHDYYSDLEIWNGLTHLARHPNNLIYSEDLVDVILKEIEH